MESVLTLSLDVVLDSRSNFTGVLDLSARFPPQADWSLRGGLTSLFGAEPKKWLPSSDTEKVARYFSHMPTNLNVPLSKPKACDNKDSVAGLALKYQTKFKNLLAILLHVAHSRPDDFERINLDYADFERIKSLPFDDVRCADVALLSAISLCMDEVLTLEKFKKVLEIERTTGEKPVEREDVGSLKRTRPDYDTFEKAKEITKLSDFELKAKRKRRKFSPRYNPKYPPADPNGRQFRRNNYNNQNNHNNSNNQRQGQDSGRKVYIEDQPAAEQTSLPSARGAFGQRGRGKRGR